MSEREKLIARIETTWAALITLSKAADKLGIRITVPSCRHTYGEEIPSHLMVRYDIQQPTTKRKPQ